MTSRTALISNPRSHLVSRRGSRLAQVARTRPAVPLVHTGDLGAFAAEMSGLLDNGVTNFFIEGGDGTVLAALTACYNHAPGLVGSLSFALLPGGSTNLAQKSVGLRDRSAAHVVELIDQLEAGGRHEAVARQTALVIQSAPDAPARIGFLLSTGALARAMEYVQTDMFSAGRRGSLAVASSMFQLAAFPKRFRDGNGKPLFSPSGFRLEGSDADMPDGEHAFSLATTLPALSLRIKPFWGTGEGDIHLTYAPWPINALRRAILRSLTGFSPERLEEHGYKSCNTDGFSLSLDRPWMLDGEIMPTPDAPLRVSTTQPLAFLR